MPNPPELVWLDNLTPKSTRFEDTYYSQQSGLDETRYVFIDGNDLTSRWLDGQTPIIGELGFGTGLNFLATWHALEEAETGLHALDEDNTTHRKLADVAPQILDEDNSTSRYSTTEMTFVSFEKYPMDHQSLSTALSPWPELSPLATHLLEQWAPDQLGWQTMSFGSIKLHLFIGDAAEGLKSIPRKIDAWYLDGFNPKTNPDLWALDLMRAVHAVSSPMATLASYTAAGWVRRNLAAAGFDIAKRKGFGHKRDMITGRKSSASPSPISQSLDPS